ncbi:MAG TPA: hypothetical protein DDW70_06235 [Rikenellaceae bacterium]|jgi:hypothetical protein|nr:hypothetical protein [Rikenellaceae bacterium]
MKRLLAVIVTMIALTSCGVTKPLYYWGGERNNTTVYELLAYKDYKSQTPQAICDLIYAYEDIVRNPGGSRQIPPPGICAEYGYLILLPTTAATFNEYATKKQKSLFQGSDYAAIFTERGQELLNKEMEYYPESSLFILPLLKKIAR